MSEGDKTVVNRNHAQYSGGGGASQPRQPNSLTQSKVLNIIKNQNPEQVQPAPTGPQSQHATKPEGTMRQLSLPVAPSGLRAEAVEFVPKARQNPPVQQVDQGYPNDRYYYSGQEGDYYDPAGVDYYLDDNFGELTLEDTYESADQPYYSSNYSQASIEDRFDLALKILTTNPSNHEEYLKPICDEIVRTSAYDRVAPNIVENLYMQCILEDNFRYIGARICQYLNSSLKMDPIFIKRFVKRCQFDFDKREQLVNGSSEDKKKLQGLGMLLAEIFLNVETSGMDGSPQRLGFLPTILIKSIETLLSNPEDANVKCACQMLKLSGSLIEDVVKSIPDQCVHFEGLFDSLRTLPTQAKISENAKFHVDKIVKLKDDDWETSLPAATSTAYNPYAQNSYYEAGQEDQGTVYYDSPGKEAEESGSHLLTEEEEADFLAWQSYQYDGYKQDPGMGFEMEEAYEEFLKQQTPSNYNSFQMPSSGTGPKASAPVSAVPAAPAAPAALGPDPYHYYGQHNAPAAPTHHNAHHPYGSGGGFYPQETHYQQQQQQLQQQHYPLQHHHQPYANVQYNHQLHQQQMPPPPQQPQHPQYPIQHQQQYQPPQPRYSSHNPPPQNDQYHFRR